MAKLTFIGATRQVTGSCYLLETGTATILLECGMYQGSPDVERQNQQSFPFDVKRLDAVVISHTHLDHCGLLPRLVREGFRGPVYMTPATHDLIEVMLKDAAYLEEKDIEWENKQRLRAGKKLVEPLYTEADVDEALSMREVQPYGEQLAITPDIFLTYHDAGHILGSAIVEIQHGKGNKKKTLVFSGDLGNSKTALLDDPTVIKHADTLLLESTYGDRDHRSLTETLDEFRDALQTAMDENGNVLIPAFTIGRTQEVLFWLGKFHREGLLKQQKVFLDSPMAIAASDIYCKHLHLFNDDEAHAFRDAIKDGWNAWLPPLHFSRTPEESMHINKISGGAIVIAGSGMCSGGRIRHHLKNNLWRNNTHIIIVGFQAQGTLGRALVDGAERVSIFGKEIAVNASIHTLGGFSAHADQGQLLDWAGHFSEPRPDLYLVHGELEKMLALQKQFHQHHQWYANIPQPGESIKL
jgi:metallo-beta-lactamase family protein